MQTVLRNLSNKLLELIIEFNKATGDKNQLKLLIPIHIHTYKSIAFLYTGKEQPKNKIKKTVTKASNRIKYLEINVTKTPK